MNPQRPNDQLYTFSVQESRDGIYYVATRFEDWGLKNSLLSPFRVEDVANSLLTRFLKYRYGNDPARTPPYVMVLVWPGVAGSIVKEAAYALELRTVVANGCRNCTAAKESGRSQ